MKKYTIIFLTAILILTASALAARAGAPQNDMFNAPVVLTLDGATAFANSGNVSATKEAGEPTHAENAGGASVWFSFTPPQTTYARIYTMQTTFNTLLAVYQGASIDNLTFVGSNDNCSSVCDGASMVDLMLVGGQTYRIAVDGYNDNGTVSVGSFRLVVFPFSAPSQDNFEAAHDLGFAHGGSIAGTNFNATAQAGEPVHSGGVPATKSVWYKWQPSGENYSVDFELTENFNSVMTVFSATTNSPTFAQLTREAHSSDNEGFTSSRHRLTFYARTNRYYFISVDGYGNNQNFGNFQLKFYGHRMRYSYRTSVTERATIGVFRPGSGTWYSLPVFSSATSKTFGASSDVPVPADYNGDNLTDYAVTRSENGRKIWYINQIGTTLFYAVPWGLATDREITGDFDRDGVADIAVTRPTANGLTWYIRQSSDSSLRSFVWGANTDKPVLGDFDGDGATDAAVVRNENGVLAWYILKSGINVGNPFSQYSVVRFGAGGDRLTAEDYDGDLKTDVAVYRPSDGSWYILRSSDNQIQAIQFGAAGDIPQPADYNGDGKAEPIIFRPSSGTWFTSLNPATNYGAVQWGQNGDVPLLSMSTLSQ